MKTNAPLTANTKHTRVIHITNILRVWQKKYQSMIFAAFSAIT